MLDENGYRPNVGIVLADGNGQVVWARRIRQDGWQFPQGGVQEGETAEQAMWRELYEEVGLIESDVDILAATKSWLKYQLPEQMLRKQGKFSNFVGQKQKWFLLHLKEASKISFTTSDTPEFDHWEWVSYWYPLTQIVDFKRDVYQRMLKELAPTHANHTRLTARKKASRKDS